MRVLYNAETDTFIATCLGVYGYSKSLRQAEKNHAEFVQRFCELEPEVILNGFMLDQTARGGLWPVSQPSNQEK